MISCHTIPIDTNQLSKLTSRDDVETWWMRNDQSMNLRSEHGWTIDVQTDSSQNFVGTHTSPSATHDDDSGVLDTERERERECHGVSCHGILLRHRVRYQYLGIWGTEEYLEPPWYSEETGNRQPTIRYEETQWMKIQTNTQEWNGTEHRNGT